MPDINNAIALGVQTPPPQKLTDVIAPIQSLAQLQYLNANAEKVKAETGQIGQTTQFTQGKLQALSNYNDMLKGGERPEVALQKSGLAAYDPAGATAMLGNIKGGLDLQAVRNYKPGDAASLAAGGPALVGQEVENQSKAAGTEKTKLEAAKSARELAAIQNYQPGNPASLAAGGPEMVGKELTNQSTAATAAKTGVETTDKQLQLYGQVGNVMASDPSPKGREMAADLARKAGVDEKTIQQFINLPDHQYILAGQHFQQAAMTPEKYMETSGQTKLNQGRAEAATSIQKVEPGQSIFMGPAARDAFTGAAPASGAVGPSLGNFAPPNTGAPSLTPAGPTPDHLGAGGTPTSPAAAAGGIGLATPAQMAQPGVRNVNAVATPSVGVNVPQAVTAAGTKYGISPEYMARTFQIESGGNPNAYNAQSKAAGPFQFVPSTGAKYLNGASPFDVAGSADAAARLAADNKASLTQTLGRAPSDAELYLAHQQGATGAAKLLANPNTRAGDLVGNSAIAANGGNPNAPASAFTNLWATKFNGGVGKSIPQAAVSPNITPVAPANAGPGIPGSVAPLEAALTPTPQPQVQPAPALQAAPVPIPAAAPSPAAIQPVTSSAPPPTGLAADNAKPLTPVIQGMSKEMVAEQEGVGKNAADKYADAGKQYQAAQSTKYRLDLIDHSINELGDAGWMGAKADQRANLAKTWNTIADQFPGGDKIKIDPSKIANMEDFNKQTTNLGFELAKSLGSREAMQIVQQATNSVPNASQTMMGAKLVSASLRQAVQRQEDYYSFLDAREKHGESLVGADKAFADANPVSAYSKAAIASSGNVVPIDSKVEYDHLPKGATFTRDGKTWQKP